MSRIESSLNERNELERLLEYWNEIEEYWSSFVTGIGAPVPGIANVCEESVEVALRNTAEKIARWLWVVRSLYPDSKDIGCGFVCVEGIGLWKNSHCLEI